MMEKETEKAFIVAVELPAKNKWPVEESLAELVRLTESAGATVVGQAVQKQIKPHPATFLGQGKVQEIAHLCGELTAELLIFNQELSPAQKKNLEEATRVRVIDRVQLILDIFAQRARTKEGKIQVELAQLNYLLPRLTGLGTELSRLGGGIGTRGPGETKLEVDRRRIYRRIAILKRELKEVQRHRTLLRQARQKIPIPLAALVGYTNAGKSTLLNTLTAAGVLVENKLFATLDPTTRQVVLPNNETILLTDTVGFIHRLPPHLVAAFRATLEEVVEADLILHLVDATAANNQAQIAVVEDILTSLGVQDKPTILVYNKIDELNQEKSLPEIEDNLFVFKNIPTAAISALTGQGIKALLELIAQVLAAKRVCITLFIPYHKSNILSLLHQKGQVLKEEYRADGTMVKVDLEEVWAKRAIAWLK
ncbi:MAG: GTPase HflX [Peptococcaceae bacterium]